MLKDAKDGWKMSPMHETLNTGVMVGLPCPLYGGLSLSLEIRQRFCEKIFQLNRFFNKNVKQKIINTWIKRLYIENQK